MKVKFFKKKEKNPQSEELLNGVKALLTENGVTDTRRLNECSLGILRSNIKTMQAVGKGKFIDTALAQQIETMKGLLAEEGITEPDAQDQLILKYFSLLGGLVGVKDDGA